MKDKVKIDEIWSTGEQRRPGTTLQLEITARCNLRCPACNQGMGGGMVHGKEPEDMTKVFWKILTDLEEARFQPHELQLFWFGEPLLHKDFYHMFQVLLLEHHRKGLFDQIDLHTNALLMDDRIIDLFLLAGPAMPEITFSLDAVRPETYNLIRTGGNLNVAVNNIIRFLERREELGQILPAVRLQLLVQPANADEVSEFIDFWSEQLKRISKKGPLLSHVRKYCGDDNFRNRWESQINHPIYPHESWKFSTYKAMMHWKDSIWLKRLNVLPLSRQAEMDALYEKVMIEQGIYTHENEDCRIIAEIDNRIVLKAMEERKGIDRPFDANDLESEKSSSTANNVVETHCEKVVHKESDNELAQSGYEDSESGNEHTEFANEHRVSSNEHRVSSNEQTETENELVESERKIEHEKKERVWKGRAPCVSPFGRPVIRFDGQVTVCCNDPLCSMSLGSVYENTLDELFFGELAQNIRLKHASGKAYELEICRECRNLDGAGMSPEELIEWAEYYGEEDLILLVHENTVEAV